MDNNMWLAVLIVGGIIAFYVALEVLKGVTMRGIDKLSDAGMRKVEHATIAGLDEMIAVPLVITTSASRASVRAALDRVVEARATKPGFGAAVWITDATDEKVVYAWGNRFYPQQVVAEVRLGERDGVTQCVFRCVHIVEKNGMHDGAPVLMRLRDAVKFAVEAAGDEARIAEGVRVYGPPEPGSPRAIRLRNRMWVTRVGIVIGLGAIFKLGMGVYIREIPLYLGLLCLGAALLFIAWRMELRDLALDRAEAAGETLVVAGEHDVVEGAPLSDISPSFADAPPTVNDGGERLAQVRATWEGLSHRNKRLVAGALLAFVVIGAVAFTRMPRLAAGAGEQASAVGADGASAANEVADQPATGGDASSIGELADTPTEEQQSFDVTPNGQSKWMQSIDLTAGAPDDGSIVTAQVNSIRGEATGDMLELAVPDEYIGMYDEGVVDDIQLGFDEVQSFEIDGKTATPEEFRNFLADNQGTTGVLEFTKGGITKLSAHTPGDV